MGMFALILRERFATALSLHCIQRDLERGLHKCEVSRSHKCPERALCQFSGVWEVWYQMQQKVSSSICRQACPSIGEGSL